MSRERHLLNRIQQQADKIKELEANLQDYSVKWDMKNKKLEADWLDEHTKGVLKTKEIEKLRNIIRFIQRGMEGNEQFLQVVNDLKGGIE